MIMKRWGLRERDYTRNSKGESVLIKETGWAEVNENPTHMILQFSSSHGGAFYRFSRKYALG